MRDLSDCIQQLSSSTEFKKALKVLIKCEINCLYQDLHETWAISLQQLSSSTEFKKALKDLIKFEINCLLKRLSDTGEEAFVITTNIEDGLQGYLGTEKGEGFLQVENTGRTLKEKFIQFCTDPDVSEEAYDGYDSDRPVDFSQKVTFTSVKPLPTNYADEAHNHGVTVDIDELKSTQERSTSRKKNTEVVSETDDHVNLKNGNKSSSPDGNCHESMFFHESDEGMVCRPSRIRRIFEETDDRLHAGADDEENCQNHRESPSKRLRNNEGNERNVSKSPEDQNDRKTDKIDHDADRLDSENNPECWMDRVKTWHENQCKHHYMDDKNDKQLEKADFDDVITKPHNSSLIQAGVTKFCNNTDDLGPGSSNMISSFYSDFHAHSSKDNQHAGWIADYPHFSYYGSSRSPHDLDYLNQCYFRGMTNDHAGELLDFSIKKENQSKSESSQQSVLDTSSANHLDKSNNNSNNICLDFSSNNGSYVSPDRARTSHRYNSWKNSKKRSKLIDKRTCENRNESTSDKDLTYTELRTIKTEPDEALNLKKEPGSLSATVKVEPGTSSAQHTPMDANSLKDGQAPSHTIQLNFSCRICGQVFKNRQYRDFHVKAHGTSCQYFCNLCSKGFHNETDYKKHQSEHTEPVFQCETCGYRCTREFRMRAHKEICGSPNKVYKCPFCHKQFAAQRYMRIHIKSHDVHNVHTCPICQNTYPLKNSLLKHMKKKHSQMENQIEQQIGGRDFSKCKI